MHVTETQTDELTRQFKIAVPAADIERKVEAKLNELAHSVQLPGFRPGKVPVALLRKRYGSSVKNEVVEQAINETSQAVIDERGIRVAMPPRVELEAGAEQGDLEYTLAVELLPQITPPDYAEIRLERLVAEVDDAEIDRRLRRFAEAIGEETLITEVRPVQDDDIVVLDVLGPEDKWPFDSQHSSGVRLQVGQDGPLSGFGQQLIGLSVGDRGAVTITFPADVERKDLAGTEKTFEIEVREVRTRKPAEIDDELAKRGGWADLDEMRNWVRQQHETELRSYSRLRLKRALLDRLAELYTFNVPKGLLDREYAAIVRQITETESRRTADASEIEPAAEGRLEQHQDHDHHQGHGDEHHHHHHAGHGDEHHQHHHHAGHDDDHHHHEDEGGGAAVPQAEQQEYRALAERRVRLGLVLAEIGRSNNLRVTPEELGKQMVAQARRFPGQEQAVLEFLRKTPDAQEALAAPILEDKVVDFVLEMAQVTERTVPVTELLRDSDDVTTSPSEADREQKGA
jgi:trigger factor